MGRGGAGRVYRIGFTNVIAPLADMQAVKGMAVPGFTRSPLFRVLRKINYDSCEPGPQPAARAGVMICFWPEKKIMTPARNEYYDSWSPDPYTALLGILENR